jgi:RNA polymerase primary sigma factor
MSSTNRYINTKEDSMSIYLKDVRKSERVNIDEELALAKRISEGDEKAIDELVTANLRFVISVAKDYQYQGLPLADLISEGNYGLITAAKRFDHTKGFRFISYAVWWVKQSILQSLNDNSRMVRLPANMINKLSKIRKEIDSFEKEFSRPPAQHEVEMINVPTCTSINNIINEDGDELASLIKDDTFRQPDNIKSKEQTLKSQLKRVMETLSARERDIVNCYFGIYGEPMTLEMIGDEFDLTKERIRQIKQSAIRKIRNNVGDILDYL